MSEKGIKGMLELIVPRLLRMIMEKQLLTEKEALTQLYASDLYRQLEREETKLWHLSILPYMKCGWRKRRAGILLTQRRSEYG